MTPQEIEVFGLHVVALDYTLELLAKLDGKQTKEEWTNQAFIVAIAKARSMSVEDLQALIDQLRKSIPG